MEERAATAAELEALAAAEAETETETYTVPAKLTAALVAGIVVAGAEVIRGIRARRAR